MGKPIMPASRMTISPSGRLKPTGAKAFRTRCILPSKLVKVPSFSAKLAAGNITEASLAVSVMNISVITRQSRVARNFLMLDVRGKLATGFSPMMSRP